MVEGGRGGQRREGRLCVCVGGGGGCMFCIIYTHTHAYTCASRIHEHIDTGKHLYTNKQTHKHNTAYHAHHFAISTHHHPVWQQHNIVHRHDSPTPQQGRCTGCRGAAGLHDAACIAWLLHRVHAQSATPVGWGGLLVWGGYMRRAHV